MTKAQILADIEAKSLKVVAVEEELDAVKNAAGIKQYIANVLEQSGDRVSGRNVAFYIIDEGGAGEAAYYRDVVTPKNVARNAVQTYLNGLVPATYIRTELGLVNEEQKSATASAYKDNGDGTCKKVELLVFKNGSNPIAHREIA